MRRGRVTRTWPRDSWAAIRTPSTTSKRSAALSASSFFNNVCVFVLVKYLKSLPKSKMFSISCLSFRQYRFAHFPDRLFYQLLSVWIVCFIHCYWSTVTVLKFLFKLPLQFPTIWNRDDQGEANPGRRLGAVYSSVNKLVFKGVRFDSGGKFKVLYW